MGKQPTCEERVDAYMEDALQDIRNAREGWHHWCCKCGEEFWNDEEWTECPECESDNISSTDSMQNYEEGALECSPLYDDHWTVQEWGGTVYRLGLSYGGPSDGFYLFVDADGRAIRRVKYYFMDWFDGAWRHVTGDDLTMVIETFESWIVMPLKREEMR
jgi:hypothetical protein